MKLTRYLYHIEDVKYSFLTSLLKGDDIKAYTPPCFPSTSGVYWVPAADHCNCDLTTGTDILMLTTATDN